MKKRMSVYLEESERQDLKRLWEKGNVFWYIEELINGAYELGYKDGSKSKEET